MFKDPLYMSDEEFKEWRQEQNRIHENMTMEQAAKIYGKPSDVPSWMRGEGEMEYYRHKESVGDWVIAGLLLVGFLIILIHG